MRRFALVAGLASTAALATAAVGVADGGAPAPRLGALETGVIARVNDGDTITLRDGRKVRLLQIDAPELDGDCYGQAARRAAARLMPVGTTVSLQRDAALDATDRYGRLLRYVEAGGLNMNAELVVVGAAVPFFFRNARGRFAPDLLAAVATARRGHLGLWKACPGARLDPARGSLTGPA